MSTGVPGGRGKRRERREGGEKEEGEEGRRGERGGKEEGGGREEGRRRERGREGGWEGGGKEEGKRKEGEKEGGKEEGRRREKGREWKRHNPHWLEGKLQLYNEVRKTVSITHVEKALNYGCVLNRPFNRVHRTKPRNDGRLHLVHCSNCATVFQSLMYGLGTPFHFVHFFNFYC